MTKRNSRLAFSLDCSSFPALEGLRGFFVAWLTDADGFSCRVRAQESRPLRDGNFVGPVEVHGGKQASIRRIRHGVQVDIDTPGQSIKRTLTASIWIGEADVSYPRLVAPTTLECMRDAWPLQSMSQSKPTAGSVPESANVGGTSNQVLRQGELAPLLQGRFNG